MPSRRHCRAQAIAKDEKSWNRTDAKFAALLAKTTGRQPRRRRRTAPVAAFAPVPVAARNAAFLAAFGTGAKAATGAVRRGRRG